MDIHEDFTDELSGEGMIMIDGRDVGLVPYSLSLAAEAGPLIAEGSISAPEDLMKRLTSANDVKLALQDGPVITIRCEGGLEDTIWVKALRT